MDGLRHWPSASARAGAILGELVLAACALSCDAYDHGLVQRKPTTTSHAVRGHADAGRADAGAAMDASSVDADADAGSDAAPDAQPNDAAPPSAEAAVAFDPDTCNS